MTMMNVDSSFYHGANHAVLVDGDQGMLLRHVRKLNSHIAVGVTAGKFASEQVIAG